jgi:hypothetical protein
MHEYYTSTHIIPNVKKSFGKFIHLAQKPIISSFTFSLRLRLFVLSLKESGGGTSKKLFEPKPGFNEEKGRNPTCFLEMNVNNG